MNEMQTAARKLHALGFKTLPIKQGTKEPAIAGGVNSATDSDAATDAYYAMHPNAGIGVSGDGFVIFDFDVKDGIDGRDQLLEFDLPDTLAQTTPSGGYHLFYRTDREIHPSVNSEIAVDVRGWHSYVVCDPTPGYCFEDDDVKIAEADESVMRFLEHVKPKKQKTQPFKSKSGSARKTREGEGRNQELFAYGASLQSASRPDWEIEGLMYAYNKEHFEPPLDKDEFEKTVNSVLKTLSKGHSDEVKKQEAKKNGKNYTQLAKRLIKENHACFIDGVPAVFVDNRYRMGWEEVSRAVLKLDDNANSTARKEAREYIALTAPNVQASPPNLIGFQNGVLDIETMAFRDFQPSDIIQNVIPHDWNPNVHCALVDETLRKLAAGDPTIELNLSEFMGLALYRSGELAYFPILLGKKGKNASNGKSTYIKMIRAMVGAQNCASLSFNDLKEKFLRRYIAGKLANLGDDISAKQIDSNALEVVKKAAAGDRIFCDVKGGNGFEFDSYCTFVFSANKMPSFESDDDGLNRRMFPLRFNARFTRDDPDFDPRISKKLETEEACQRMLVKAIQGLRRCIENDGPTPNAESKKMLEDIKVSNNSILQWMKDVERDEDSFIGCIPTALFDAYREWCEGAKIQKPYGKPGFGRALTELFGIESHTVSEGGKKIRRYRYVEQ